MEWRHTYNDLCEEISALEERAKGLEEQLSNAYGMCMDGKMPGDSFSRIPLDKALESYDNVSQKLQQVYEWLEKKKETRDNMDKCVGRMTGLEHRIAYHRTIMRQSFRQIATELGYSEGYLRNVHYRIAQEEDKMIMRNVSFL